MNKYCSWIGSYLQKPVVLIGMMGAGKSHIGRKLAEALHLDFFDSDRIIEEKAGRTIAEIFQDFGEEKFRLSEKNTIIELLQRGPCVISTGGGAVMNSETLQAIKTQSVSVWLKADMGTTMERLRSGAPRPLLKGLDPERALEGLMEERKQFYSQADITLETGAGAVGDTLEKLIKALYGFLNTDSF
jgi:shikimate kinase